MTLSYRFKKFRLEGGTYIKRPVVNVILKNESKSLEFLAILDSGSDLTTIQKSVAEYLCLKAEDKESKVTITFKGKAQRQDEALNNVPVAIMQDPEEEDVIIGTSGVFEQFKIIFNDTKNINLVRLSDH